MNAFRVCSCPLRLSTSGKHDDPRISFQILPDCIGDIRPCSTAHHNSRHSVANQDDEATFFCGGSRNFKQFLDLFDEIFILDVDAETLNERLDSRPDDDWGKSKSERELILRLHATKEDIPSSGIVLDATQPLVSVVDEILSHIRS